MKHSEKKKKKKTALKQNKTKQKQSSHHCGTILGSLMYKSPESLKEEGGRQKIYLKK